MEKHEDVNSYLNTLRTQLQEDATLGPLQRECLRQKHQYLTLATAEVAALQHYCDALFHSSTKTADQDLDFGKSSADSSHSNKVDTEQKESDAPHNQKELAQYREALNGHVQKLVDFEQKVMLADTVEESTQIVLDYLQLTQSRPEPPASIEPPYLGFLDLFAEMPAPEPSELPLRTVPAAPYISPYGDSPRSMPGYGYGWNYGYYTGQPGYGEWPTGTSK